MLKLLILNKNNKKGRRNEKETKSWKERKKWKSTWGNGVSLVIEGGERVVESGGGGRHGE